MRLEENNPIFRQVIIPWYDSGWACAIVIGLMVMVYLFGSFGISVSADKWQYMDAIAIPVALMGLAAFVILSTAIRLIRRHLHHLSRRRKSDME